MAVVVRGASVAIVNVRVWGQVDPSRRAGAHADRVAAVGQRRQAQRGFLAGVRGSADVNGAPSTEQSNSRPLPDFAANVALRSTASSAGAAVSVVSTRVNRTVLIGPALPLLSFANTSTVCSPSGTTITSPGRQTCDAAPSTEQRKINPVSCAVHVTR